MKICSSLNTSQMNNQHRENWNTDKTLLTSSFISHTHTWRQLLMAQTVWPWRPSWGSWGTQSAGTPRIWPPRGSPDMLLVMTWWGIRVNYHRRDDCWHEAAHLARHTLAGRHLLTAQTQRRGHWPLFPPFLGSFPRGQWPVIRPPAASVVSLNLECHGEQEESGGDL